MTLMHTRYQGVAQNVSPKISIITPVYNKENYLEQCIKSLAQQSLSDIEIIVVDDCSTDSSRYILERFSDNDSRIRLLRHSHNMGIIHARKTGLLAARGQFIVFVDADDFLDKEACEKLYDFALSTGSDFVQFNARVHDDKNILDEQTLNSFSKKLDSGKFIKLSNENVFLNYGSVIKLNLWRSLCSKRLYDRIIPFIKTDAPRRADDNLIIFFLAYFSSNYAFCDNSYYNYRANETSSNLNRLNIDVILSQIEERAKALDYAKWFAKSVGLCWDDFSQPFYNFNKNLVSYATFFLDHGLNNLEKKERLKLLKLFGDYFKGDALLHFANSLYDDDGNRLDARVMKDQIQALKSSFSWKITRPLRSIKTYLGR